MNTRTFTFLILITALLLGVCTAALAAQNSLLDVRVGMHKQFERVVFELAEQATAQITVKPDQKIEIRFIGLDVPQNFVLPEMPRDISILKRIDAFREGDTDVMFELTLTRDAIPSELPLAGTPWRLAIDLAPRTVQTPDPKPEPKPEYIPGDLPIPTKLAGEDVAQDTSQDNSDAPRVYAALAYFYMTRGDTASAHEQAELYQKATGKTLDLTIPAAAPTTLVTAPPSPPAAHSVSSWMNKIRRINIPTALILGAIFVAGLLGGLVLHKVFGGWRPPRISIPRIKFKRKERPAKADVTEELEQGLEALDDAVAQEPPRRAVDAAPPPEPEPVLEPVAQAEDEVRESLMDRRVRRVLELSRGGRSVTDIAEELQMGQDEVKLILDLNQ